MVAVTSRTPRSPLKHLGVSLVEMVVALAVFSAVVFPIMVITTKAGDQLREHQNQSVVKFELTHFLSDMQEEVGQAYRFLPLDSSEVLTLPVGNGANITSRAISDSAISNSATESRVFLAYVDSEGREQRVGFKVASQSVDSQARWVLYKAENIPATTDMWTANTRNDYGDYLDTVSPSSSVWKPYGRISSDDDLYLEPVTSGQSIRFVYCLGSDCGTDASPIAPDQADSVRLQAGTRSSPGNIRMVFRNAKIELEPMTFRLASIESASNRMTAENNFSPLAVPIRVWNNDTSNTGSWVSEYIDTTNSNLREPRGNRTSTATPAPAYTSLSTNDMYFDNESGELYAVSNSATSITEAERGLYIFKFRPGYPDTAAYSDDPYPISIHQGEPGYRDGMQFVSVTSDGSSLYVLGKVVNSESFNCYISKFDQDSASYQGQVQLLGNATGDTTFDDCIGITYNPASGGSLGVLTKEDSNFPLRRRDLAMGVRATTSLIADTRTLFSTAAEGMAGLEFDNVNNRVILLDSSGRVISFNSSNMPPTQISRGRINYHTSQWVNSVAGGGSSGWQRYTWQGLAYNPRNNTAYVSRQYASGSNIIPQYFAVIPTTRLNQDSPL